jgi:hypothetical protein
MLTRKLAAGVALGALALALCSTAATAQEITGGMAGHVSEGGKPVGGAQVKVTNVATGVSNTTTTGDDGFFSVGSLPVGGPYRVTTTAPDKTTQTTDVGSIPLGAPYQLDVAIGGGSAVTEITVTAAPAVKGAIVQTGPRTVFTATDIQTAPSFAGDLKDLARMNPFVTIDAANGNAMTIAGTNNHFNTIYLDGVRQSDDFGLNNSGYPTQRSPFSIDVVQAFNVEVAPYEVQYGNFQGGILNVVTKSGTNSFHGSADYSWDSNDLSGKHIGADALRTGPAATDRLVTTKFNDTQSSFTFSGPIWKDHIFFMFGYSEYNGIGAATFNPQDQPGANPIAGVLQSDVVTTQTILKAAAPGGYGYDPLNYGGTGPVVDTKAFGKIDWYITDNQHLFVSYQNTDGSTYQVPNGSTSSKILNLQSNDYNFEQKLVAWTADLTSHWTDAFSTEIEFTHKDVESPTKLFTGPFSEFKIALPFPSTGSIFLGPDISRQANNLSNIDQQIKLKANYRIGDHVLLGGYEHEKLDEFDLFVQNATGTYTFSTLCGPGAANGGTNNVFTNLQAHVACALTYQNAFDNNPQTAATSASNTTDTLYAEDEWHVSPDLTVRGGLRYEGYGSSTKPLLNPRFVAQYGFANNRTIDGEYIVMPRLGFNWHPEPTLTVTGGVGLFSGGNPGVYTYDSYTNPGNLLGTKNYNCSVVNCATQGLTGAGTSALIGVTGSSIPANVQADITSIANAGAGTANALDPHFKPPSVWKASISIVKDIDFSDYANTKYLGDGWRLHADFLAAKTQETVLWQDIWELQYLMTPTRAAQLGLPSAVAPDGRPIYDPTRYSANPNNLTPAPVQAYPWLTGTTTRTSGSDILLTNAKGGDAIVWAIGVSKTFRNLGLTLDYTYSHQNVRDVSAATSSVATSNFNNEITADPNHPGVFTSDYQILYEHRFSLDYTHAFIGNNRTSIRLFVIDRAGLPFSYAFCTTSSSSCTSPSFNGPYDQLFGQGATSTTHQLLYVPKTDGGNVTATSDPLVTIGPGFNLAAFNSFLRSSGLIRYAGSIAPRNAFRSSDVVSADLQLSQEFPAWFPGTAKNGAKGEFYLDVINLPNLINKNWGIDNQVGFPYVFAPVTALNCQFSGLPVQIPGVAPTFPTCVAGRGNFYQFNTFRPPITAAGVNQFTTVQSLSSPPVPTWVIKMGVRFKF